MGSEQEDELKPGDKVQLVRCPGYPLSETHRARITSYSKDGKVSVRYFCDGYRKSAIVRTDGLIKIRSYMNISKPAIITGVSLLLAFMVVGWFVANYNGLVGQKADVDNAWAKVETQYQRRLDLIQNIVGSVKGDQKQEQKVFGDIAEARKQVSSGASTDDKAASASKNESTIVSIVPRLQEAYPELKSDGQVSKLIEELKTTENAIADGRNKYNDTVTNYNVGITRFPKNIFANMFGFGKSQLYKADSQASNAPKVDFNAE